MSKPGVIIVDDERLAREEIRRYLEGRPVEIFGEAENADDAAALIDSLKPDLIFLDIQMPGGSGFDLLETISHIPEVVFTTAFDQYAVKAFEVNAIDYLVKPVRAERFHQAMERVTQRLQESSSIKQPGVSRLFVRDGNHFQFIDTAAIHLIESSGNYAKLFYAGRKYYLKRSLNQLEKILDPSIFFRASRTALVNTTLIERVHIQTNGSLILLINKGEQVPVSSRQSAVFKSRYKI